MVNRSKKRGNSTKLNLKGISEKFEEIAEMYKKISNLIGFRLFLIRFRVERFHVTNVYTVNYSTVKNKISVQVNTVHLSCISFILILYIYSYIVLQFSYYSFFICLTLYFRNNMLTFSGTKISHFGVGELYSALNKL